MARRIEQLARDAGQREAMGLAGRRRAEEEYSLQACAASILRVYALAIERPVNGATQDPQRASATASAH
jgi:glycosyltransferase involved in cell wall biosynthesis